MLIQLNDYLIVDTSIIEKASRCGNYTDVRVKGEPLIQIWDEDWKIWRQIINAAKNNGLL